MTESNEQPTKSTRMAALTNTSYGLANEGLARKIRWLLAMVCTLALIVVALGWWRQGAL